jgi:hypothetical protein
MIDFSADIPANPTPEWLAHYRATLPAPAEWIAARICDIDPVTPVNRFLCNCEADRPNHTKV